MEENIRVLPNCISFLFRKCWHFFFPKKLFSLGSILEALYKVVTGERWLFTLTSSSLWRWSRLPHFQCCAHPDQPKLEDGSRQVWACRGNSCHLPLGFPQTSLSSFACQQEGQTSGWAAAQPEVRKVLGITDQPSGDNPPMVSPCRWDARVLAHESAHSCSVLQLQCLSASDRQGPLARPHSPPLHHTWPLSSTDANGLGSFLSYRPSHCPLEVLSLVFLFQLELATHHSLPRHNAALCGCLQHGLGNAVTGTGPQHERKGLC